MQTPVSPVPSVPNPQYAELTGAGIAALVLVSIVVIAKYAKGFIANISVLLGIIIGAVVATAPRHKAHKMGLTKPGCAHPTHLSIYANSERNQSLLTARILVSFRRGL